MELKTGQFSVIFSILVLGMMSDVEGLTCYACEFQLLQNPVCSVTQKCADGVANCVYTVNKLPGSSVRALTRTCAKESPVLRQPYPGGPRKPTTNICASAGEINGADEFCICDRNLCNLNKYSITIDSSPSHSNSFTSQPKMTAAGRALVPLLFISISLTH